MANVIYEKLKDAAEANGLTDAQIENATVANVTSLSNSGEINDIF